MEEGNQFGDVYRSQLLKNKSEAFEKLEYTRNDFALTDPNDQEEQRNQFAKDNNKLCIKNKELNKEILEANLDFKEIDQNQDGIKKELDKQDNISTELNDLYKKKLIDSFRILQTQLNQLNNNPQKILHYLKPYQLSDPVVKNLIKTLPDGQEILTNYQEWQKIVEEYQKLIEQYDGTNYQIDEYENQIDEIFLNNMVVVSETQPKSSIQFIKKQQIVPKVKPKLSKLPPRPKKLPPKLPPQEEVKLPPVPKKLPPPQEEQEIPSILQKLPPPPKKPVPVPGQKKQLKKKQLIKKT